MSRHGPSRDANWHEMFFALLMLTFVGTLVYLSFDLTRSPRLLPQLVGIPTVIFLIYQLIRDSGLFRRTGSKRGSLEEPRSSLVEADEGSDDLGDMSVASLSAALDEKQREEGHTDERVVDEEGQRRMAVFTLWCLALVVGAATTSFLVVTAPLLFGILYLGTRRVMFSAVSTAITYGFIWFVFENFLGVRF